jgi:hypothetical protein
MALEQRPLQHYSLMPCGAFREESTRCKLPGCHHTHPSHLRVASLAIPPHALQLYAQQSRSCSSLLRDAERRSWRGGGGWHLQLEARAGSAMVNDEEELRFCVMKSVEWKALEAVERLDLGTVVGLVLLVTWGGAAGATLRPSTSRLSLDVVYDCDWFAAAENFLFGA